MLITSSSECFTVLAVILTKDYSITNPATNITLEKINLTCKIIFAYSYLHRFVISGTLRILDLYNCADLSSSAAHDVSKNIQDLFKSTL